ncbi:hypothetical protein GCM10010270_26760 [Streptomyces violaceus]|nr:hypothetical protein GCM10010270_26760 [Streptomyces janthinus]
MADRTAPGVGSPAPVVDAHPRRSCAARRVGLDRRATGSDSPHTEVFRAYRAAVEERFTGWHQVTDHAHALGYDVRTLARATRAAAGTGAKAFLDQRIPLEAKRLVAHTNLPVGSCARRLGFRPPSRCPTRRRVRHSRHTRRPTPARKATGR